MELKESQKRHQKDVQELKINKKFIIEREKELSKYKSSDPFMGNNKKNQFQSPQEAQMKQEVEKLKSEIIDRENKLNVSTRKVHEY